jgi:hypothetical protein
VLRSEQGPTVKIIVLRLEAVKFDLFPEYRCLAHDQNLPKRKSSVVRQFYLVIYAFIHVQFFLKKFQLFAV